MRREFSQRTKLKAWERSGGHCEKEWGFGCGKKIMVGERRVYDHIVPDALTGLNDLDNCQVLCDWCDKKKTAKDVGQIRKADRQKAKHIGAKTRKGSGFQTNRDGKYKRKMDGTIVERTPK